MKKFLLLLLAGAFLSFATNFEAKGAGRESVLKIYNWADYIDESLIDEFIEWYKEQTGEEITIIYQTFDINEVALAKIERGKEDYDVMCPSEYIIERMLDHDMLIPIDTNFGDTPNYLGNVSPYITAQFELLSNPGKSMKDYSVAYMWGTTGLLYNVDTVTEEEASSWSVLWNDKFEKRIFLKDAVRDVYSVIQIYANADKIAAGGSIVDIMNDSSEESVANVESLLKAAKGNIAGWEVDFGKEMMTKKKADISLSWSGDAVWAIEEAAEVGVELDYIVPEEGSNVWFDGWVIPKYAKNVKAASYFINFMCMPENAIRNMDEIGYVSAVATPEILEAKIDSTLTEYVDLTYLFGQGADSLLIDPIQYPDAAVIARCAMMRDFGDRTPAMVEMWSRVKGDNLGVEMIAIIAVVVFAIAAYLIYKRQSSSKKKRYRNNR